MNDDLDQRGVKTAVQRKKKIEMLNKSDLDFWREKLRFVSVKSLERL
jgi:hypothetical protein